MIKINSFGGPLIWLLRKNFSMYTSKLMLEYVSIRYEKRIMRYINNFMDTNHGNSLFKIVNIETVNRCNGKCAFCPANVKDEKRPLKIMSDDSFKKIISQLKDMKWEGIIFLNVNNEPFIDKDIIARTKYIRENLGDKVTVAMFSNGSLITPDKLEEIKDSLDLLIINNYSTEYRLNERIKELYKYVKARPDEFANIDIRINRRYSQEILATRAGNAPNKHKKNNGVKGACIYPYTDLTIFPDGAVGLCCNDCFETTNYGNINESTLCEIWNNPALVEVRKKMRYGRENISFCKECDVSDSGIREEIIK